MLGTLPTLFKAIARAPKARARMAFRCLMDYFLGQTTRRLATSEFLGLC